MYVEYGTVCATSASGAHNLGGCVRGVRKSCVRISPLPDRGRQAHRAPASLRLLPGPRLRSQRRARRRDARGGEAGRPSSGRAAAPEPSGRGGSDRTRIGRRRPRPREQRVRGARELRRGPRLRPRPRRTRSWEAAESMAVSAAVGRRGGPAVAAVRRRQQDGTAAVAPSAGQSREVRAGAGARAPVAAAAPRPAAPRLHRDNSNFIQDRRAPGISTLWLLWLP